MESKYIYVAIALIVTYLIYDKNIYNKEDERIKVLEYKSNKTDSIVNLYNEKIDSLSKTAINETNLIDSNIYYIDSLISIMVEEKQIDSNDVNEALLWADSVSQYH